MYRNLMIAAMVVLVAGYAVAVEQTVTIPVFDHQVLHFNPDSSDYYVEAPTIVLDNGREAQKSVTLPEFGHDTRILAHVILSPIPKSVLEVHDRWDRAGNLRLTSLDGPDIELVRFMTSYGGETTHTLDVTHLASLLTGQRDIIASVDTWVSPGWMVTLDLEFRPDTTAFAPDWVAPVYYAKDFNAQDMPSGVDVEIEMPEQFARVVLTYISTGHCTDGTDEDEFVAKPNVISVDGVVVERLYPWRDDCREYRDRNPYTAKWTDGTWSSDYSRSGWCPGMEVDPIFIDLTDHLTIGKHSIHFEIEDMRPIDDDGNFGYWRLSSHVVGWKEYPKLWMNY